MSDKREEDRIWTVIDSYGKAISDHCIRITTLEQDHKHRDKNKAMSITYIVIGIAIVEGIILLSDKLW